MNQVHRNNVLKIITLIVFTLSQILSIGTADKKADTTAQTCTGGVGSSFSEPVHTLPQGADESPQIKASSLPLSCVSVIAHDNGDSNASAGSGIIYSLNREESTAIILTNCHVIYSSSLGTYYSEIYVHLFGTDTTKRGIPASVIGSCESYDTALLLITSPLLKNELYSATVLSSEPVCYGEKAIICSNGGGKGLSLTEGVISIPLEYVSTKSSSGKDTVVIGVMRTDAHINKGSSGGAIFNSHGRLIGMVNAKSASRDLEGIGYAIPADTVDAVSRSILLYGRVLKCTLPFSLYLKSTHPAESENGVFVYESLGISDISSQYDKILYPGDTLISLLINGNESRIYSRMDAERLLISVSKGDSVELTVERHGSIYRINIPISHILFEEVK